jgi:hypothetical protein
LDAVARLRSDIACHAVTHIQVQAIDMLDFIIQSGPFSKSRGVVGPTIVPQRSSLGLSENRFSSVSGRCIHTAVYRVRKSGQIKTDSTLAVQHRLGGGTTSTRAINCLADYAVPSHIPAQKDMHKRTQSLVPQVTWSIPV